MALITQSLHGGTLARILIDAGFRLRSPAIQPPPGAAIEPPSIPLVLATDNVAPVTLARILLALPTAGPPVLAVTTATDRCAQRLLHAHPAVVAIIAPAQAHVLPDWLIRPIQVRQIARGPLYIGMLPAQAQPLTLEVLRIVVTLAQASSMEAASAQTGYSRRSLARILQQTRAQLQLPSGAQTHYRPGELAEHIWQALATLP